MTSKKSMLLYVEPPLRAASNQTTFFSPLLFELPSLCTLLIRSKEVNSLLWGSIWGLRANRGHEVNVRFLGKFLRGKNNNNRQKCQCHQKSCPNRHFLVVSTSFWAFLFTCRNQHDNTCCGNLQSCSFWFFRNDKRNEASQPRFKNRLVGLNYPS